MTPAARRVCEHRRHTLKHGWSLLAAPAGSLTEPAQLADLPATRWIQAPELGPAAAVLRALGEWTLDAAPRRFDAEDWWYRLEFEHPQVDTEDEWVLGFDGLATLAEVWLNDEPLLQSRNMFVRHELGVGSRLRAGRNLLLLRFQALDAALTQKRPRPRWRAPMVENQQLRWVRTTLLGRTPGWSPPAAVVGPWKDIWLERRSGVTLGSLRLTAGVEGRDGVFDVSAELLPLAGRRIDRVQLELQRGAALCEQALAVDAVGRVDGRVRVPDADLWWPHTHGEPALYAGRLRVHLAGAAAPYTIELGGIGFRDIVLDKRGGRLALQVNGVPVFCRGACWTPIDAVALRAPPQAVHAAVAQVRAAGMNMLRVGGTMVYEDDAFHAACDELGVLVWQDFMFANMDYPDDDPAFVESVRAEVTQQLARWQGRPSLAVLCGNSEVEQQAAMWGAPRERWSPPLFHSMLPEWIAAAGPQLAYWPSSAHGGAFPHQANSGSTSYYGVGAYQRPLDDARRAELSFATECLAFSNLPDAPTIARMPGASALRVHHPAWKARAPRDLGAGWDFEDVRDHYIALLFGLDPVKLRYSDHERYLALGRVATGEVMAASFAEWRRPGSSCGGALVWFLRDLWAGAGWGLLDDSGAPKACFHTLRRALQPVAVAITDEGVNGLFVQVINEPAAPLKATLELLAYNDTDALLAQTRRVIEVEPRGAIRVPFAEGLEGFMDLSYAYRFGPPPAALVLARLLDAAGQVMAEAFAFPAGLPSSRDDDVGLRAELVPLADGSAMLTLSTTRFAQNVHIDIDGHVPDDNHFHLAPASSRSVRLQPADRLRPRPLCGHVHCLNAQRSTPVEAAR